MTTIMILTELGKWDEAARQFGQVGLTLTRENTITVMNEEVQTALFAIWWLAAAGVIAGFSVESGDIHAASV